MRLGDARVDQWVDLPRAIDGSRRARIVRQVRAGNHAHGATWVRVWHDGRESNPIPLMRHTRCTPAKAPSREVQRVA